MSKGNTAINIMIEKRQSILTSNDGKLLGIITKQGKLTNFFINWLINSYKDDRPLYLDGLNRLYANYWLVGAKLLIGFCQYCKCAKSECKNSKTGKNLWLMISTMFSLCNFVQKIRCLLYCKQLFICFSRSGYTFYPTY